MTVEYRTDPSRVAELLARAADPRARRSGPRRRGDDLRRLAELRARLQRARRPCARAVQGGVHRRALPVRGPHLQPLRLHLGRQGLRHGARPLPGLPEEARQHLDDSSGHHRQGRSASRSRWTLRRHGGVPGSAHRPTPASRCARSRRATASSTGTPCCTAGGCRPSRPTAPMRWTSSSRCRASTSSSVRRGAATPSWSLLPSPVEEVSRLEVREVSRRLLALGRHDLRRWQPHRAASRRSGRVTGPRVDGVLDAGDGRRRRGHRRPRRVRPTASRTPPSNGCGATSRSAFWEEHDGGKGFWAITRYDHLLQVKPQRRGVLQRGGHHARGDGPGRLPGPSQHARVRPAGAHPLPPPGEQAVLPAT